MNCFIQFSRCRIILSAAFCLINSIQIVAQDLSPKEYFGDSYTEAIRYCQNQKTSINTLFTRYGISPEEAISIVFPEIIRYNRFSDFAETTALEIAYVQAGKNVADFSIGHFQMKPSFVESLERELLNYKDLSQKYKEVIAYEPNRSNEFIRSERIERLKQEAWQLKYLACFIRLAEKRFAKELNSKPQERLMILSSAYNKGLNSTYEELKDLSEKKTFPYGKSITGRFSYYDVANYFYTHDSSLTLNPKL